MLNGPTYDSLAEQFCLLSDRHNFLKLVSRQSDIFYHADQNYLILADRHLTTASKFLESNMSFLLATESLQMAESFLARHSKARVGAKT